MITEGVCFLQQLPGVARTPGAPGSVPRRGRVCGHQAGTPPPGGHCVYSPATRPQPLGRAALWLRGSRDVGFMPDWRRTEGAETSGQSGERVSCIRAGQGSGDSSVCFSKDALPHGVHAPCVVSARFPLRSCKHSLPPELAPCSREEPPKGFVPEREAGGLLRRRRSQQKPCRGVRREVRGRSVPTQGAAPPSEPSGRWGHSAAPLGSPENR